jgi:hypothetical protein
VLRAPMRLEPRSRRRRRAFAFCVPAKVPGRSTPRSLRERGIVRSGLERPFVWPVALELLGPAGVPQRRSGSTESPRARAGPRGGRGGERLRQYGQPPSRALSGATGTCAESPRGGWASVGRQKFGASLPASYRWEDGSIFFRSRTYPRPFRQLPRGPASVVVRSVLVGRLWIPTNQPDPSSAWWLFDSGCLSYSRPAPHVDGR